MIKKLVFGTIILNKISGCDKMMKSIRVKIYYWGKEECEQAMKLKRAILACSHVSKDVEVVRKPHPETQGVTHSFNKSYAGNPQISPNAFGTSFNISLSGVKRVKNSLNRYYA